MPQDDTGSCPISDGCTQTETDQQQPACFAKLKLGNHAMHLQPEPMYVCVYVCMYACKYIYIDICVHTYAYVYVF